MAVIARQNRPFQRLIWPILRPTLGIDGFQRLRDLLVVRNELLCMKNIKKVAQSQKDAILCLKSTEKG